MSIRDGNTIMGKAIVIGIVLLVAAIAVTIYLTLFLKKDTPLLDDQVNDQETRVAPSPRFYKWFIVDILGGRGTSRVQAGKFVFQIDGTDYTKMSESIPTTLGDAEVPYNTATKLVDGSVNDRWGDSGIATAPYTSTVVFEFPNDDVGPGLFSGYRWQTANDATARDPIGWTISSSVDGITWTNMHSVTAYIPPLERSVFTEPFVFDATTEM